MDVQVQRVDFRVTGFGGFESLHYFDGAVLMRAFELRHRPALPSWLEPPKDHPILPGPPCSPPPPPLPPTRFPPARFAILVTVGHLWFLEVNFEVYFVLELPIFHILFCAAPCKLQLRYSSLRPLCLWGALGDLNWRVLR